MKFIKCVCGYKEREDMRFIGIFQLGKSFQTTENESCCLFGCPRCGTVQFVTDKEYIKERKKEYKERTKNGLL